MRIIGGYLKGRTLRPKGKIDARPTTDFAKEALFNILENKFDLSEMDVLDLFAGTGNISFEFISRNVKSVTALELSQEHINTIFQFAKELKVENIKIVRQEIFKWVEKLPKGALRPKEKSFDLIFADPPYTHPKLSILPENIIKSGLLRENGTLIIEHGKDIDFSSYPFFDFHRKYGNVNFSFFEYKTK